MNRPHLSKSVDELELLFSQANADLALLQALADELIFRKTSRAKELEGEVRQQLARLRSTGPAQPSPEPGPQEPVFPPRPPLPPGSNSEPIAAPPPSPPSPRVSQNEASPANGQVFHNRAASVLEAWTALEVLQPQTFKRPSDLTGRGGYVASIENGQLPWDQGPARSRPQQKIYFHVVVGTIKTEPAYSALLERYLDSRGDERPSVSQEAILASVLVDKEGVLAGDAPISLSAFAWGLPVALRGSLTELANWTTQEGKLIEGLNKQLRPNLSDPNTPLTWETIQRAYNYLVQTLGLGNQLVNGPKFAIASFMPFTMREPPDALGLNSFYLSDLALARSRAHSGSLSKALSLYLGIDQPAAQLDLLHDASALERVLAPGAAPLGRWPTELMHQPALLQQSAVNAASAMSGKTGVLGVNGPPGTGKSTLLRDIAADQITRRAEAMCAFSEPTKAFKVGLTKRQRNETIELYTLDPSLKGFEMVVASSNNKAVANVSAEMPALSAIPADQSLSYFAPLAEELLERPAWGMVAAVLGNNANKARFRRAFWTESKLSFKRYLEHVTGLITSEESAGGLADRTGAPSSAADALSHWQGARTRFLELAAQVRSRQGELEQLRLALRDLPRLSREMADATKAAGNAVNAKQAAQHDLAVTQGHADQTRLHFKEAERLWSNHEGNKPALLVVKRWFSSSDAKAWDLRAAQLRTHLQQTRQDHKHHQDRRDHAAAQLSQANTRQQDAEQALGGARKALAEAQTRLSTYAVGPGARVLDAAFLRLSHMEKQLAVAWLDQALQTLRQELFIAAMRVHRAFIDAAALPMLRNLNALMSANFNLPPDRKELASDLWSSLFLVVPVLSTTFASVSRMLRQLPDQSLGWLMVDEAGQAVPQAAVGALLRTRRAVVVGDPLQVEPVVTLPDSLTRAVMQRFEVDPDRFCAPSASVQTLADDASEYTTRFTTLAGSRSVGAPLLVHRRCASPMFEISNRIAYAGLMVPAKPAKASLIRNCLGASRWISTQGTAAYDKFSHEEAEAAIALLTKLRSQGIQPDLYIVTPFRSVASGMRDAVTRSGLLRDWVDDPSSWVDERIGTVHTVQGREAEAVIFVLGAPSPAQAGARNWAGSTPNLLNVAVTRAKEALYVVGNRQHWRSAGHFGALDQML